MIAVFLGVIFGIFVGLFIVVKSRQRETAKFKQLANTVNISPTIAPVNKDYQSFEIIEPQDNFIFNEKTIKIKGRANKDDLIIIQSPIQEITLKIEKNDFLVDFPLAYGENVIRVSSYPKDQSLRSQEKQLLIYYLDEE